MDDQRDYAEEAYNRQLLRTCEDCGKDRINDCTCRECRVCGDTYDVDRDNHADGMCPACADKNS